MARGSVKRITTPKRKDARWEARLSGHDRDGARRQFRRRFPTRKAAEAWLSEMESRIFIDGIRVSADMTLDAYAEVWHARMAREWAPSTYRHRTLNWARNFAPFVGERKIADITRVDCQRLVDRMVAAGHKPNSIVTAMAHLTALLKAAVEDEIVTHNRAKGIDLPRARRRTPATWTVLEVRHFIASTAGTQAGLIGHLMVATGIRVGEALALAWRNVDLDAGRIRVQATMQLGIEGGMQIAEAPKTESSRRVVPLTAALVAALRTHRACQQETLSSRTLDNRHGLVFTSITGDWIHPNTYRYEVDVLIRRAGLPRITPHGFRHVAATIMMEEGVHPLVVSRILGHTKVAITLDTYSHPSAAIHQDAIDRLGTLFDTTTPGGETP